VLLFVGLKCFEDIFCKNKCVLLVVFYVKIENYKILQFRKQ